MLQKWQAMDYMAVGQFPVTLSALNKENILKPELIINKEKYEERNKRTQIPRISSRTL